MKSSLNRTVNVISGLVQKYVIINNIVKQSTLNQQNYQQLENRLNNLEKLFSDNSGEDDSSDSSDSSDFDEQENTTRIILSGAIIAPEANGVYTLSEGTVEMTTYISDNTGLEVTEPIVTSDTAKFVREDGWVVYANFASIPWTWEVDDASDMLIYLNQTMSNDQRGGFRGTSVHQGTFESDGLTSVLKLSTTNSQLPTDYKLQVSGCRIDILNGIYTMVDPTATGYDRVWEYKQSDSTTFTIKSYNSIQWKIYENNTTVKAACQDAVDPYTYADWLDDENGMGFSVTIVE